MSHKIQSQHLTRLAAVYIRQSSPGQVRNNSESYRVQKKLIARAEQLGWPGKRTQPFEADQGTSASKPMARDDFDALLRMIQDRQVGIVFSVDVTRLARNAIDMSMLIHWCAVHATLIADQHQVYDPATPEDSLVLGIQGVLAVSELHAIRQRLQAGLDEKARRGELHHSVPRGYVLIDGIHLRQHPDRRVQQVIGQLFERFATCPSVSALLRWTWDQNLQLPRATSSDGLQVEWVAPNYRGLMDLLRNPKYAGVYVHPRYQREPRTDASGKVQTHRRLSLPSEWTTVLHDHHPAYITLAEYQSHQEKIAMNAQRYTASRGSVNRGASLLAGLVTCRRCGHRMQVHYSSTGRVSYGCRSGRRQRDTKSIDTDNGNTNNGDADTNTAHGTNTTTTNTTTTNANDTNTRNSDTKHGDCFRFSADELERQLSEQVLYAVSPAGVAAAELAAERLASERSDRRAALSDQLEQLRYEADLTRRRLDAVDPANRLVYSTLCEEWEANLQSVSDQEQLLLQFDTDDPPRPTSEERELLNELGDRLDVVWHDASTDGRLKQQVVRLLVDHVYADLVEDRDEVVLWLKWTSGHHTELRSRRCRRRDKSSLVDPGSLLETLRKILDDASISRALNRSGIRTESGESWTSGRVASARQQCNIPAFDAELTASSGWLTQSEAATRLGISPMSVWRLIQAGVISSEGQSGLPRVISSSTLSSQAIQAAVKQVQTHQNAPLPTNPQQKTLFS